MTKENPCPYCRSREEEERKEEEKKAKLEADREEEEIRGKLLHIKVKRNSMNGQIKQTMLQVNKDRVFIKNLNTKEAKLKSQLAQLT